MWGPLSRPRVIAPDYELVVYAYTGVESITLEGPTALLALKFLLHLTPAGWRLAGFDERLPSEP